MSHVEQVCRHFLQRSGSEYLSLLGLCFVAAWLCCSGVKAAIDTVQDVHKPSLTKDRWVWPWSRSALISSRGAGITKSYFQCRFSGPTPDICFNNLPKAFVCNLKV